MQTATLGYTKPQTRISLHLVSFQCQPQHCQLSPNQLVAYSVIIVELHYDHRHLQQMSWPSLDLQWSTTYNIFIIVYNNKPLIIAAAASLSSASSSSFFSLPLLVSCWRAGVRQFTFFWRGMIKSFFFSTGLGFELQFKN